MAITHPGLPRLIPADSPEAPGDERARRYSIQRVRLDYSGGTSSPRPASTRVGIAGDHLYVLEIQGADQVGIRLGDARNPYIPVREGDIITREYAEVYLRPMGVGMYAPGTLGADPELSGAMSAAYPEVLLLSSWGPCLSRAFKEYGFRRGFIAGVGQATATGVDVIATIAARYGYSDRAGWPLVGRFGGTIIFKNRDETADIWIGMGVPLQMNPAGDPTPWPGADTCFPVGPGESITLQLESLITNRRKTPFPGAVQLYGNMTLVAMVDFAGTAPFAAIISQGAVDGADEESGVGQNRVGYGD